MRGLRVGLAYVLIPATLSLGACRRNPARDDKALAHEVQARLYQDPILRTRDISVIVQHGVVTLPGQVQSEEERTRAAKVASSTEGVKQVINQLVIVRASPAAPEEPAPATQPAASNSRPQSRRAMRSRH